MRRLLRPVFAVSLALSAAGSLVAGPSVAASAPAVRITWPARVEPGVSTAIRLTLPRGAAAVDGRLLSGDPSLELVGVAPLGGGTGLRPVAIRGGAAFGAYDLRTVAGVVRIDLVVVSSRAHLDARVVVDSVATSSGRRLVLAGVTRRSVTSRSAVRGLALSRTIGRRDEAVARAEWAQAQATGGACGTRPLVVRLDVDGDGCADIVDIQSLRAARGRPGLVKTRTARLARISSAPPGTIVVDSAADTADASPGDGTCADGSGRCTLRAAIMESELATGDVTVDFDLPGTAPVTIDLGSQLPFITRLTGSLTIDGYSQPGSSVNTEAYGSNAVPGVRIKGNGIDAAETGLYITSGHNLVRGLILSDVNRGIFIDGPDAVGNRIMGNWIGFDRTGGNDPKGEFGVIVNNGPTDTRVGSPGRADRNVIGNFVKAIDHYGPGTRRTVTQGNLLCIAPGGAAAGCSVGIDHDFGPKDGLIGGDGPGERNVIGPTRWEGVELSHGWDRRGNDDATWRITGNRVIGNWIGFRIDGHYDPDFRSGLKKGTADATGIHLWDGTNDNFVARNTVGSHFDGIRMRTTQARRNQLIGNVIGVSPRGEKAPMAGWGIHLEQGLRGATLEGNVIRNAASGGVGLQDTNVTGVRISETIVGGTSGPAIWLARSGSIGANHLIRAPKVTSARASGGGVVVRGTARAGSRVEVYRSNRATGKPGAPSAYLGHVTVPSNGAWRVTVTGVRAGDRVTTLQIRPDDDTSAMSKSVRVKS